MGAPRDPAALRTGGQIAAGTALLWGLGSWLNMLWGRALLGEGMGPALQVALVALIAWVSWMSGLTAPRRRLAQGRPWRASIGRNVREPGLEVWEASRFAVLASTVIALPLWALNAPARNWPAVVTAMLLAGAAARRAAAKTTLKMLSESGPPPAPPQALAFGVVYAAISGYFATLRALAEPLLTPERLAAGVGWSLLVVGLLVPPLVRARLRLSAVTPAVPQRRAVASGARGWLLAFVVAALAAGATYAAAHTTGASNLDARVGVAARVILGGVLAGWLAGGIRRESCGGPAASG